MSSCDKCGQKLGGHEKLTYIDGIPYIIDRYSIIEYRGLR